jgi:hypothetical protein
MILNKNLLILIASLTGILFFVVFLNNYLVERITDKVINELKRTYTPGPYDPGYDPDKVNPSYFREPELSKIQVPMPNQAD